MTIPFNVRIVPNGDARRKIHSPRLAELSRQIQTIRDEDPSAICPTPFQLLIVEERGQIWNYETGQAEDPDPCDHSEDPDISLPIPLRRRAHIVDGRTRVPIIGTISRGGIGIYTVKDDE
jgi:hypothetical protein